MYGPHSSFDMCQFSFLFSLFIYSASSEVPCEEKSPVELSFLFKDIAGDRSPDSGSHLQACKALLLQRSEQDDSIFQNSEIANSLVIQSVRRANHTFYLSGVGQGLEC